MSLILILAGVFFSLLLSPKITFAGEDYNHRFNSAIAYTIGWLPEISFTSTVDYSIGSVVGYDTVNFYYSTEISSLTIENGVIRNHDVADRISAPPGSQIDILYYYENRTNKPVTVNEIFIPMSSTEDITTSFGNITTADPESNAVFIPDNGIIYRRGGYYGRYPINITVPPSEKGKVIVDSIYIKNPIEVVRVLKEVLDDQIKVEIEFKNVSNENFENLELIHTDKSIIFSIPSQKTKILRYSISKNYFFEDENGNINIGPAIIVNDSSITKCGIGNTDPIKILGMYTNDVFYSNLTGGISGGSLFVPTEGSFCITRIPYAIMIRDFLDGVIGDISDEEENSNGDNSGGSGNNGEEGNSSVNDNVLGENTSGNNDGSVDVVNYNHESLAVLPDTGKRVGTCILLFLVVDLYLWYSYFREKKKYGSKNKDTKICTRYSKDSA